MEDLLPLTTLTPEALVAAKAELESLTKSQGLFWHSNRLWITSILTETDVDNLSSRRSADYPLNAFNYLQAVLKKVIRDATQSLTQTLGSLSDKPKEEQLRIIERMLVDLGGNYALYNSLADEEKKENYLHQIALTVAQEGAWKELQRLRPELFNPSWNIEYRHNKEGEIIEIARTDAGGRVEQGERRPEQASQVTELLKQEEQVEQEKQRPEQANQVADLLEQEEQTKLENNGMRIGVLLRGRGPFIRISGSATLTQLHQKNMICVVGK